MKTNTQRTHENYIISFTDGTVKIGTTCRHTKRVKEVVKKKLQNKKLGVVTYYVSDLRTKENAYRAERDTCYFLRKCVVENTREWIRLNSCTNSDIRSFSNYIKQTLEVFASGVRLQRGSINGI